MEIHDRDHLGDLTVLSNAHARSSARLPMPAEHRPLVSPAVSLRLAQTDALLTSAVLDGADSAEIARRFGELSGLPVALVTPDLTMATCCGDAIAIASPPSRQVNQALAGVAAGGDMVTLGPMVGWSGRRTHIAPLLASGQLLGFLVMGELRGRASDSDGALSAFQHAVSLCAIAMLGERRRSELVNELRYDLVAGMLVPNRSTRGDQARWGELLGLANGSRYRVLCARVTSRTAELWKRDPPQVMRTSLRRLLRRSPDEPHNQ